MYLIPNLFIKQSQSYLINIIYFLFYFFISMAGLMLIYSLVWKDFERKIGLFAKKGIFLHIFGLVIAYFSTSKPQVMFISMLFLFLYGIILSYSNYIKDKSNKYTQLYFITMILGFMGYLFNFLLGFFPNIKNYVYLGTIFIFLFFLYGTLKFQK